MALNIFFIIKKERYRKNELDTEFQHQRLMYKPIN